MRYVPLEEMDFSVRAERTVAPFLTHYREVWSSVDWDAELDRIAIAAIPAERTEQIKKIVDAVERRTVEDRLKDSSLTAVFREALLSNKDRKRAGVKAKKAARKIRTVTWSPEISLHDSVKSIAALLAKIRQLSSAVGLSKGGKAKLNRARRNFVMLTSTPVTIWYRFVPPPPGSESKDYIPEFNHIEDGFIKPDQKTPTPKHPSHSSWARSNWKKEHGFLQDGVLKRVEEIGEQDAEADNAQVAP